MMANLGQRLPNVSFNVEFFSHRMESDNAKFVSENAERFIATPAEVTSGYLAGTVKDG